LLTRYIHSRVFGTVDYPILYDFKRLYRKTMGPVAFYACQVAKEVLEMAGLDMILSFRGGWRRFRSHPREPDCPAEHLQNLLQRRSVRICSHRRRGLSEIHGSHHGSEYNQNVRHHRPCDLILHSLHDKQPVHRLWL